MGAGVLLTIGSLLYIIVLGVVYFSKIKIDSLENRIFKRIIISNIFGLTLHLLLFFLMLYVGTENTLTVIVSKLYLIYLITYMILFTDYVFIISSNKREFVENNFNKIMLFTVIIIIFTSLFIIYLPIEFHNELGKMYSYGLSVQFVYIFGFLMIFLNVIFLLKNIKHALSKKYYPLFLYFLLGLVTTIIQFKYPYIQLITAKDSFIIFLMYFTIENPDIRMAKELAFSKEIAEESRDKTLEILDNIYYKIEDPLNEMKMFKYKKINFKDNKEISNELKYIYDYCSNFAEDLSGLIDIGKIESGSLKLTECEYETSGLFDDIKQIILYENLNNKVKITTDFDLNIPNILYGNKNGIKQMILYVCDYLIDVIKINKLHIKVNYISSGNLCKLKFNISTNSKKIEEYIFNNSNLNLTSVNVNKDNVKYIKMKRQEKLINAKLKVVDNSNLLISFNQKITDPYTKLEQKEENTSSRVRYFDASSKKILVLGSSSALLKELTLLFKPYNINMEISKDFEGMKRKLSSNKVYDLVLIDDKIIENYQSLKDIELIKKFAGYDLKFIIILSSDKDKMINIYLENGYDDYIVKPLNKKDINKMLIKYFKSKNT